MNHTQRTFARIAGSSLLAMAIIAGFAYGYAFQRLYIPDDASGTVNNLNGSPGLFRWLVFSFAIILVLDIIAAWALYFFFKGGNAALSLLSAWLRLVYSALLGVALSNLYEVLPVLQDVRQHPDAAMEAFQSFSDSWSLGLIIFGCHLFVLGVVAFDSRTVPRIWAVMVLIASVCYIGTNAAQVLVPDYDRYTGLVDTVLALPMALGELGLAAWLLVKGGRKRQSDAPVPEYPFPDPAQ
ncbi:DUF4386 domain-containing protein [Parapedobacter sp. DT-150]|uniref:DUF4386 domain-containing protein n=1 Tax=Parapedobacter sp. DT-150 TaxID=3396162 RepID=UPI003F1B0490